MAKESGGGSGSTDVGSSKSNKRPQPTTATTTTTTGTSTSESSMDEKLNGRKRPAGQICLSSDEVNYLIFRYLQEAGFVHTAFCFAHESMVGRTGLRAADRSLPPGALVTYLQKGLQYVEIEESLLREQQQQQQKQQQHGNQQPSASTEAIASSSSNSHRGSSSGGNGGNGRDNNSKGDSRNSNSEPDFSLLSSTSMAALTRRNPPIQLNVPPATAAAAVKARLEAEAKIRQRQKEIEEAELQRNAAAVTAAAAAAAAAASSVTGAANNNNPTTAPSITTNAATHTTALAPVNVGVGGVGVGPALVLPGGGAAASGVPPPSQQQQATMNAAATAMLNDPNNAALARQALINLQHQIGAQQQQQPHPQSTNAAIDGFTPQQQQPHPSATNHTQLQHPLHPLQQQPQQQQSHLDAVTSAMALQQQSGLQTHLLGQLDISNTGGGGSGGGPAADSVVDATTTAAGASMSSAPSGTSTKRTATPGSSKRSVKKPKTSRSERAGAAPAAAQSAPAAQSMSSSDAIGGAGRKPQVSDHSQQQQQLVLSNSDLGPGTTTTKPPLLSMSGTTATTKEMDEMMATGAGPVPRGGTNTLLGSEMQQQQQQGLIINGHHVGRNGIPATALMRVPEAGGHPQPQHGRNGVKSSLHVGGGVGEGDHDSNTGGSGGGGGGRKGKASSQAVRGEAPDDSPTAANEEEILKLNMHQSEVFMCSWNPVFTNLIATGSGDASARIWEMVDKTASAGLKDVKLLPHGSDPRDKKNKDVTTLEWSPDGTLLATGSYDGVARVWARSGPLIHTLQGHHGPIFSLKWNKKGNYLLSGSYDKTTMVWDVSDSTGHVEQQFIDHKAPALDVDWKDNDTFASCSTDKTVHICRVGVNRPIKVYTGHTDEVNAVKWDPSGRYLASCSDDCTAKVWDVESDRKDPLYDFKSHQQEIYTVKWSPTGVGSSNPTKKQSLLATASFDGSVRLWKIDDGSCHRVFNRHRDSVYSVAFSPSGDFLASGSLAGQMYIWNIEEGRHIKSYKGKGDIFEVAWNKEETRVAACFSSSVVAIVDFDRNKLLGR